MRNRMIFSVLLIATIFMFELVALSDQNKVKGSKEFSTKLNAKDITFNRVKDDDKVEVKDMNTSRNSISLPDVVTYFMSAF